jgi:hypothetical protein
VQEFMFLQRGYSNVVFTVTAQKRAIERKKKKKTASGTYTTGNDMQPFTLLALFLEMFVC